MTEHDEFDRSLSERLRAYESRVTGGTAPGTHAIASGSPDPREWRWGWGLVAAGGGMAAGLILALVLNARIGPPTGQASPTADATASPSATPQATGTASAEPSSSPATSAAGLIAVSRDGDIYLIRPDGTEVSQLTDDAESVEWPLAWLADGSRLAFVVTTYDRPYSAMLNLVAPDGTATVELGTVGTAYSPPTRSPDGAMVAFGGDGAPGSGIAVLDLVGGTFMQLTADGGHGRDAANGPLWSPDGTLIAYRASGEGDTGGEVRVVSIADGMAVTLAPHPSEDAPTRWTVVDGVLKLVFDSWRDTDEDKFDARPWIVDADGTNVQLLADSGLDPGLANRESASLRSPDGTWVAVECEAGLRLGRADSDAPHRVIPETSGWDLHALSATWSPDSEYLAYAVREGSRTVVRIVAVPDGEPVTATRPDVSELGPAWQPSAS